MPRSASDVGGLTEKCPRRAGVGLIPGSRQGRQERSQRGYLPFLLRAATAPKNPRWGLVSGWPRISWSCRIWRALPGEGASLRWLGFLAIVRLSLAPGVNWPSPAVRRAPHPRLVARSSPLSPHRASGFSPAPVVPSTREYPTSTVTTPASAACAPAATDAAPRRCT